MKSKFYQKKKFKELQSEWYDKLKEEGFEDIEWFNPKTGRGHGSPYLRSSSSPDSGAIRGSFCPERQHHYHLCRNFLAHGPFYSNFKHLYRSNPEFKRIYKSFPKFLALLHPGNSPITAVTTLNHIVSDSKDHQKNSTDTITAPQAVEKHHKTPQDSPDSGIYPSCGYYSRAEEVCFREYTEGTTIRDITAILRKLHKQNKLGKLPKRWGKAYKGKPYSVYWVTYKIKEIKVAMIHFNRTHPEGSEPYLDPKRYADPTFEAVASQWDHEDSTLLYAVNYEGIGESTLKGFDGRDTELSGNSGELEGGRFEKPGDAGDN